MIFRAKETFIEPVLPLELSSLFGLLAFYVNVNTSKKEDCTTLSWDEVTMTLRLGSHCHKYPAKIPEALLLPQSFQISSVMDKNTPDVQIP